MNTMAPTRLPEPQSRRVRLVAEPAAVPAARSQVRAAIRSWGISVDPDDAVLLTSELVTNAVQCEPGQAVILVITLSCGQLRVDVHDTSRSLPTVGDVPANAETGRGLLLVAALSADWGCYLTLTGKAVYFTLACQAQPGSNGPRARTAGDSRMETVSRDLCRGSPSPLQRCPVPVLRSPRPEGAGPDTPADVRPGSDITISKVSLRENTSARGFAWRAELRSLLGEEFP